MKLLIAFSLSACLLAAAEGQSKPSPEAPRVVKPLEIPKSAVESEPGTYRHTDADGKKWIYRKTPFGVSRMEDRPAAAETLKTTDPYTNVKAMEDGDHIRFERPGPFGVSQWKARKSELNDMERAVWNREKTRAAAKKE